MCWSYPARIYDSVNNIPCARPDAVDFDFCISPSLNVRSSFITASSLLVGKWWNRARFWQKNDTILCIFAWKKIDAKSARKSLKEGAKSGRKKQSCKKKVNCRRSYWLESPQVESFSLKVNSIYLIIKNKCIFIYHFIYNCVFICCMKHKLAKTLSVEYIIQIPVYASCVTVNFNDYHNRSNINIWSIKYH